MIVETHGKLRAVKHAKGGVVCVCDCGRMLELPRVTYDDFCGYCEPPPYSTGHRDFDEPRDREAADMYNNPNSKGMPESCRLVEPRVTFK